MTAGAVKTKLNVVPPLVVTSDTAPPPLGPYVGKAKSVERPVVNNNPASRTVTVHEMISLIRITVVDAPVWPTHERIEFTEGVPKTANENVLPVMAVNVDVSFSVITNEAVMTDGAVNTNVNEVPPVAVLKAGAPAPLGP